MSPVAWQRSRETPTLTLAASDTCFQRTVDDGSINTPGKYHPNFRHRPAPPYPCGPTPTLIGEVRSNPPWHLRPNFRLARPPFETSPWKVPLRIFALNPWNGPFPTWWSTDRKALPISNMNVMPEPRIIIGSCKVWRSPKSSVPCCMQKHKRYSMSWSLRILFPSKGKFGGAGGIVNALEDTPSLRQAGGAIAVRTGFPSPLREATPTVSCI